MNDMKWQLRQLCFSRLFKFVFATQKSSKSVQLCRAWWEKLHKLFELIFFLG